MVKRLAQFVIEHSLLLVMGAVAAFVWANIDVHSYHDFVHTVIWQNPFVGFVKDGVRVVDVHFLVNDVLMAVFFMVAGREVFEAVLPAGSLHGWRKASMPVVCALGGMVAPAGLFLLGCAIFGRWADLNNGWAIPTATDIAFSYMVARFIFGSAHPAVVFLLLLAIMDDALGMLVLAVFYPQEALAPGYLLLVPLAWAVGIAFWFFRIRHFGWYILVPGLISWFAFQWAGLHPALGLLPIVPLIPHVFINSLRKSWEFVTPEDSHRFERVLEVPVEFILGVFGLMNAGVALSNLGGDLVPMFLIVTALVVGKPIGIVLTAIIGVKLARLHLAPQIKLKDLLAVGLAAGIGFTVALFVTTVAFEPGPVQDACKAGALVSIVAAPLAVLAAKVLRVRKIEDHEAPHPWEEATDA